MMRRTNIRHGRERPRHHIVWWGAAGVLLAVLVSMPVVHAIFGRI